MQRKQGIPALLECARMGHPQTKRGPPSRLIGLLGLFRLKCAVGEDSYDPTDSGPRRYSRALRSNNGITLSSSLPKSS
jgi:hypothetical protein